MTELHTVEDDFNLNASETVIDLTSAEDDLNLNSAWDTPRSPGVYFSESFYLTDTFGNILTDPSGNRLIGLVSNFLYPQVLHSAEDDLNLNAE